MNRLFLALIMILSFTSAFGQINMKDSTAQVVGYWFVGEKMSYKMSLREVKLKEADTVSNELLTYEVDITILDSTKNSYSIEWFYHDFKSNSTHPIVQRITSLSENLKVIIETNEYGGIIGVKNWQEVAKYLDEAVNELREDFKDVPNVDKLLSSVTRIYSTKEAIEVAAIRDAQQFYSFHGGLYLLGEVQESTLKAPNVYEPQKPFDSRISLSLDELHPETNSFVLSSSQQIDSEQLTDATMGYLKEMAETMGAKNPTREEIGTLSNVIILESQIHESGWVIASLQTKIIKLPGASSIEQSILEIR